MIARLLTVIAWTFLAVMIQASIIVSSLSYAQKLFDTGALWAIFLLIPALILWENSSDEDMD